MVRLGNHSHWYFLFSSDSFSYAVLLSGNKMWRDHTRTVSWVFIQSWSCCVVRAIGDMWLAGNGDIIALLSTDVSGHSSSNTWTWFKPSTVLSTVSFRHLCNYSLTSQHCLVLIVKYPTQRNFHCQVFHTLVFFSVLTIHCSQVSCGGKPFFLFTFSRSLRSLSIPSNLLLSSINDWNDTDICFHRSCTRFIKFSLKPLHRSIFGAPSSWKRIYSL